MIPRLFLLSVFTVPYVGCASTQDFCYKQSHKCYATWRSIAAGNSPLANCDYREGWQQGYFDYSTGIRCKPPTLPPKKYWSSCYQDCKGQQAISDWYAGYQKGMIAAEKECGNCFHEIRPRCEAVSGVMSPASYAVESFDVPPVYSSPSVPQDVPLVPQAEAVPVPTPQAPVQGSPSQKTSESRSSPCVFSGPPIL